MKITFHHAFFSILSLWCIVNCSIASADNRDAVTESTSPVERRIVTSFVGPEHRAGSIFQTARSAALFLNADLNWDAGQQSVRLTRGTRSIVFRRGARVAVANGKPVPLPVEPYVLEDLLMIPAKVAAQALAVSIEWERRTDSLVIGPAEGIATAGFQYIVPLVTDRTGFVIHTPKVGDLVPPHIRVQLQANPPVGKELVLQLREADGNVLIESVVPNYSVPVSSHPSRGRFTETIAMIGKSSSDDRNQKVRFVAFLRKATLPPATLSHAPSVNR